LSLDVVRCVNLHRLMFVVLLAFSFPVTATSEVLSVPKLLGEMVVDARLDEPQWQKAQTLHLTYVTAPFENTTPPVATEVRIFEDGETLYIAFIAKDKNPEDIRAFFRDRDSVWTDDLVGIKLDTFGDSRLAYQFFINPHGIQLDAIENEMTRSESDSWDAIWDSAGRITEEGYTVEVALPFRIFNFNDYSGAKRWRAEFVRFYPRENNYQLSNRAVDRNNSCALCIMGSIEGFDDAKQGQNLAIVPYVVASRSRQRLATPLTPWQSSDNQEVGMDINWGVSSDIILQATINPDFSQVEADAGQLAINNPFALFFPEQRPFFLENADFFSSMYELVYTRNINAPDIGTKVTGRINDHTFGVLVANDDSTQFLVPGNLGSQIAFLDQRSVNLAMRYRYDVSDSLSFGAIVTGRQSDNYHNLVYGADVRYQITPTDLFRFQVMHSDTQYPDELFRQFCFDECVGAFDFSESALRVRHDDAIRDGSYRLEYNHEERDWFFRAVSQGEGRDFRADLGFEARVDQHRHLLGGGYVWWNERAWWNRLEFSGDWDITRNDAGELIEKEVQAQINITAEYQSFFELQWLERNRVGLRHDPSSLAINNNTSRFTEQQFSFYGEGQPNQNWSIETSIVMGDATDLDNDRAGKIRLFEPSVQWNFGQHMQLTVTHTFSELEAEGQHLFTANLTDTRFTYQFDAQQFLRVALIYADIDRNVDNYLFEVDAQERDLGVQVIYSYMVNPLTRVFVGFEKASISNTVRQRLTSTQQSLFMKFSYAWLN